MGDECAEGEGLAAGGWVMNVQREGVAGSGAGRQGDALAEGDHCWQGWGSGT